MILLKTSRQIDCIHRSCKIVSHVLSKIKEEIKPGITTCHLDKLAEKLCLEQDALPGFKGYRGFPFSICASKNNEVVHGFPNDVPLKRGDILTIDFGVLYKGWYGDSAMTVPVGRVGKKIKKLLQIGQECLDIGINNTVPYCKIGDISGSIQLHAEKNGFNVIKGYTGHGIGRDLHEPPTIPNFGEIGTGYILKPGTVIAIEPIITNGNPETRVLKNNWTVVTRDNSLSVHFEHSVAITKNGVKVLTKRN